MGWVIETAVEWIWSDLIGAAYRRYGLWTAALILVLPLVAIGLLIALILMR